MIDKDVALSRLQAAFGFPVRKTVKVSGWEQNGSGIVLQTDQPNRDSAAYIWLPHPGDGQPVPEFALEYAAGSGRHSGTYASPGLAKGEPALKLIVRTEKELAGTLEYISALAGRSPLPVVQADKDASPQQPLPTASGFGSAPEKKPRRESIPRAVQREVWQRDGGRCVECDTRERLCYDHIVPFSRGGSNTVRNIQLLCERCNLSKGNRI